MKIRLLILTALLLTIIAANALGQVPIITSFAPSSRQGGTPTTISSTGFNPIPANNSVCYFGAIKATPSTGTANSLTVTVPAGASPLSTIVVQDNITGLQASSTEAVAGTIARHLIVTNTPELVPSYSNRNFGSNKTSSEIAVGDFNSDGNTDLVTTNLDSTVFLTLNSRRVGINSAKVTISTNINDFSFNAVAEVIAEDEPALTVYNVITPNGDGRHDFLFIENIDLYPNNSLSVYNRWGNRVFEIARYDNIGNIFTGISHSGEELLTGNYYYVIDKGNGDKRLSGFLIIKR